MLCPIQLNSTKLTTLEGHSIEYAVLYDCPEYPDVDDKEKRHEKQHSNRMTSWFHWFTYLPVDSRLSNIQNMLKFVRLRSV